ncbi:polyketide synthase dehydratase domain-containing protein, partial [Streptosporangium vulgare]
GHAEGLLSAGALPEPTFELAQWPPVDAVAVEVGDAYEVLLGMGYEYGPVFQGLRAVWRRGEEVFAEVALPEQAHGDAARFGVHPALLDAVLHAPLVVGDGQTVLPFSWAGVGLYSAGVTGVRARIARVRENTVALTIADSTGAPVLSVEALATRPISADQLTAGHRTDSLHRIEWSAAPAGSGSASAQVPGWVVAESLAGSLDGGVAECVLVEVSAGVHEVLGLVQGWLA